MTTVTTHYGHTLVGPFKPEVKPVRSGLYVRKSHKTGDLCFAWYDTDHGWSKFATDPKRAEELRHSRASRKSLPWYGFAEPAKAKA